MLRHAPGTCAPGTGPPLGHLTATRERTPPMNKFLMLALALAALAFGSTTLTACGDKDDDSGDTAS